MKRKIKIPPFKPDAIGRGLEEMLFQQFPGWFMELMSRYFRLKVEGTDNIPRRGPMIITPNHSGFAGLDAMILSHQIRKLTGRQPRVLTHFLWFTSKLTALPAQKLGFIKANMNNGLQILRKNQPILLFPEGEQGNFKPTTKAYDLQEFKRGFIRLAILTGAPIIPTLVIGAEETHITIRQLRLSRWMKGLILPLPFNLFPLPAKWHIKFLSPIHLPYSPDAADDKELMHELAEEIRERMQRALNEELALRESVYF